MEKAECFVELMHKKRMYYLEKVKKFEMAQQNEHNDVLNKIQVLRDERIGMSENITRYLKVLTTHKHNIHKILQDARDISGLPISTNYQKQGISIFADIIQFIDNIDNILESCKEQNNISPIQLSQDVISCIDSIGKKAHLVKTHFMLKDAFEKNMEFLQEQNLDTCEENTDLDGSVFDM